MIYTQVAAKVRSTHERTIETKIFEKKLQEPPSVEQPNVPDRDVRVFLPPCDTRSVSPDLGVLPDSFYSVTSQDCKGMIEMRLASEAPVMSKAARDALLLGKYSKFKTCLVRIRFSDGTELQGTFLPFERPERLYEFVQESLSETIKTKDWFLYTSPPKQVLDRTSSAHFIKLRFVPAALVHFGFEESDSGLNFLKEELVSVAVNKKKAIELA
eukprot:TRINITY_DN797_c0_g1_i18.p2 TRINITY_DN797_c0_g1~~TRINITY_DN797_c0_g1_i18.p2  ORF type:complete len:213 (+),score=45.86 TRINITY_DN797_c0_g1_i18:1103-1741(+)